MLSFDETASADENQMNMISAFENVETAQVTFAARDSEVDGKPIKKAKLWAFATENQIHRRKRYRYCD